MDLFRHEFNFYVVAHELGHVMSTTTGHNEEFRKNFAFLTKCAIEGNMYKKIDFNSSPVVYCGILIDSSII
jgi:hypothetical protein